MRDSRIASCDRLNYSVASDGAQTQPGLSRPCRICRDVACNVSRG